MAHDLFIQAGLRGLGYSVIALEPPDNAALQYGKEYGNRGRFIAAAVIVGAAALATLVAPLFTRGRPSREEVAA